MPHAALQLELPQYTLVQALLTILTIRALLLRAKHVIVTCLIVAVARLVLVRQGTMALRQVQIALHAQLVDTR